MPRTESRTKTTIWSDEEFRKRSSRAQRMYWLLFSQSTISLCGVLALTERRWAATSADETSETVRAALDELEEHRYIMIDWDTEEIFVRTFARHDGIVRNNKTFHPAWRQLANVASPVLREAAEDALRALGPPPPDWGPNGDNPHPPGPDTLSNQLENRVSPGREQTQDRASPPGKPPQDEVENRSRTRAHAASSLRPLSPASSLPDPSLRYPADRASATAAIRDVVLRTETETKPEATPLAKRLAAACTGRDRSHVNTEAAAIVIWALKHVSAHIVDEAIGWAEDKKPVLPRAVVGVVIGKAADRGIRVPTWQPTIGVVA